MVQGVDKVHYDSSKDAEFPRTILMYVFTNFVFPDGSRGIKACRIIVQTLPSEQGHNKTTSAAGDSSRNMVIFSLGKGSQTWSQTMPKRAKNPTAEPLPNIVGPTQYLTFDFYSYELWGPNDVGRWLRSGGFG